MRGRKNFSASIAFMVSVAWADVLFFLKKMIERFFCYVLGDFWEVVCFFVV